MKTRRWPPKYGSPRWDTYWAIYLMLNQLGEQAMPINPPRPEQSEQKKASSWASKNQTLLTFIAGQIMALLTWTVVNLVTAAVR